MNEVSRNRKVDGGQEFACFLYQHALPYQLLLNIRTITDRFFPANKTKQKTANDPVAKPRLSVIRYGSY